MTAKSISRCSCGSVMPSAAPSTAPSTVNALPASWVGMRRGLLRRLWHRRLVRLHVATALAGAQLDTRVELFDRGLEILLDVADVHGDLVQRRVAAVAEPEQRLGLIGRALDLDD